MSTRANIRITDEVNWRDEVQLYRHCDGYPTAVLPALAKAYQLSGGNWEAGRTGKVAAYICVAGYEKGYIAFEPENHLRLHRDVEWVYRVVLLNHENGKHLDQPMWQVDVYRPAKEFWNDPSFAHLVLWGRGDVVFMAKHAQEVEVGKFRAWPDLSEVTA